MAKSTKVNGFPGRASGMAEACAYPKTVRCTRAGGKMTSQMAEGAFLTLVTRRCTLGTGSITKCMDKEYIPGRMVASMKENFNIIRFKDLASTPV